MPFFTDPIIADLRRGNLSNLSAESSRDTDQEGNGVLHYLINAGASLAIIRQAIELNQVPIHIFNSAFDSPLDLALKQKKTDIAEHLLKQPITVDNQWLNWILGTASHQCRECRGLETPEAEGIVGFYASRLVGVDIHTLLTKDKSESHLKYMSHIQWLSGVVDSISLTGFWPEVFLPLRCRSLVMLYIKLRLGKISAKGLSNIDDVIAATQIKKAIKQLLNTYWLIRYGRLIVEQCSGERCQLLAALTEGMRRTLLLLPKDSTLIFHINWSKGVDRNHTLYLVISRDNGENYTLDIANLGSGSEQHIAKSGTHLYPYRVALLKIIDWNKGGRGDNYLIRLVKLAYPKLQSFDAVSEALYDRTSPSLFAACVRADQTLMALPKQQVGNCVVANHDAAQSVAFKSIDPSFLNWLHEQERAEVGRHRRGYPFPELPKLFPAPLLTDAHDDVMHNSTRIPVIKWKEIKLSHPRIADGRFAKVYKGEWKGAPVVVKHFKQAGILPADILSTFKNEAGIQFECDFPNIVHLMGITEEPGHYALVMEYLPSGSLYSVLHDRAQYPLPWPQRWQIAIDITNGVGYLHGREILHRDLKSLNIVLGANLEAKVTDFGMSKMKTHLSLASSPTKKDIGTISWRAPETFADGYQFEAPADIYSLGVVLWELAARAVPHADKGSESKIIDFIKDGKKEKIPTDCPKAFEQHIISCWQAPERRPQASVLAERLAIDFVAINQAAVEKLLLHVARGEQDEAEAMLKIKGNEALLLHKGKVTDYSNRTFKNITALQYALWAYDWHMWEMLLRYLPVSNAKDQLLDLEKQGTEYAIHYDFNDILSALDACVKNWERERPLRIYSDSDLDLRDRLWNHGFGQAQCRVPCHVAHEYCRPDRSFYPIPAFTDPTLPRTLTFQDFRGEYQWFPLDDKLGSSFALYRYSEVHQAWPGRDGSDNIQGTHDLSALAALFKTRTTQYAELQRRLGLVSADPNQLLLHVARGEQDAAEAMARANPMLLLHKGKVTDYSNRTFENITALQYALWAYDWHMWEMLLRYLPQAKAKEQLHDLERNGTEHGKHYEANELLQALKTYVDNFGPWTFEQLEHHWCKEVGGAQCRVPVHVANEYCDPDRGFYSTPSFTEPTLQRVLTFDDNSSGSAVKRNWFPLDGFLGSSGLLGSSWAVVRSQNGRLASVFVGEPLLGADEELSALTALFKTRTIQYAQLQQRLGFPSADPMPTALAVSTAAKPITVPAAFVNQAEGN